MRRMDEVVGGVIINLISAQGKALACMQAVFNPSSTNNNMG